jgi:hypothetical protein
MLVYYTLNKGIIIIIIILLVFLKLITYLDEKFKFNFLEFQ